MGNLVRFSVSLPEELVRKFDCSIKDKNRTNRSKAIGDLIRQDLVRKEWRGNNSSVAGAVVLIYDQRKRSLLNRISDIQHGFHQLIISTQHIHLDDSNCLEIIAVNGNPEDAQGLTNSLKSTRGVKHVMLSLLSTGIGVG